jgi:rubrerythrin
MINTLTILLQRALTMEHQAYLQYLTHREQVRGPYSPAVMALLQDSAGDEAKHAEKLRSLLSDYLLVVPTSDVALISITVGGLQDVIAVNIESEKEAIALYRQIYQLILDIKNSESAMTYKWFSFEKTIREMLSEEEAHIVELERLVA